MESLAYAVIALLLTALASAVLSQLLAQSQHRSARIVSILSSLVSVTIGTNLLFSPGRVRLIGALLTANAVIALLRTARRS